MARKRRFPDALSQSGYSLMEVMIAAGISGVVFAIMMTLLGQSADFSAYFNNTAKAIEGTAVAVSQLNSIMNQVVRVRSCGCRGTVGTTLSNCVWSDTDAWYDPVIDGGGSDAGNGIELFLGDFEGFYGGDNTSNTTQLLRTNLGSFASSVGSCNSFTSVGAANNRGCKLQIRLVYKAPTAVSGTTPSNAGALRVEVGSLTANAGEPGVVHIGRSTRWGQDGLSVSRVSCGFVQSSGQNSGLLFALNMRVKTRSTTLQDTTNSNYESWRPGGTNFERGLTRDLRFKYSFRNLNERGVYQWRPNGRRACIQNGQSVGVGGTKEDCCSSAISSGTCIACIGAGQSGDADSCCSEEVSSGTCV